MIKVPDSAGSTLNYWRLTSKKHGVITCTPGFPHAAKVIDDVDELVLKDDDVILTSYLRSGTSVVTFVVNVGCTADLIQTRFMTEVSDVRAW